MLLGLQHRWQPHSALGKQDHVVHHNSLWPGLVTPQLELSRSSNGFQAAAVAGGVAVLLAAAAAVAAAAVSVVASVSVRYGRYLSKAATLIVAAVS